MPANDEEIGTSMPSLTFLGRLLAVPVVTTALLVPAGAAAAAPGDVAQSPPGHQNQREALQNALDAVVEAGVPGVIAEVRDERGVWRGSSGVANVHHEREPRKDGRFRVGSVTKTFVATTVLQLVDEGDVELNAPIERYLPGIIPGDQGITVRQLLNHTSGLYNYTLDMFPGKTLKEVRRNIQELRFRTFQPQELVDMAMRHEPEYQPPENGSWYSNTNYVLLGMLIEEATGNEPATEIRQRIIRPLGMQHTSLPEWNPFIVGPNAHGYEDFPEAPPLDVTTYSPSWARTAGAIISTTSDLNSFYDALLTGQLLPPELLQKMKTTTKLPGGLTYGLGLMSLPGCGGKIWGHTGGVPGFTTYSFTSPDGGTQVTMSVTEGLTLAVTPKAARALNNVLVTTFCEAAPTTSVTPQPQDVPTATVPDLAQLPRP